MTPPWREATREEIVTYYWEQFPPPPSALPTFLTVQGPKQYGIELDSYHPRRGDETAKTDFIRRQTRPGTQSSPPFDTIEELATFIRAPAEHDPMADMAPKQALVEPVFVDGPGPVPKSVYFLVDNHEHGWPVYIDIDAKDIAENEARRTVPNGDDLPLETVLQRAGIYTQPPDGYPYGFEHIDRSLEYGFEVKEYMHDRLNADNVMVVYSGQGCHVYLLDDDKAHRYDPKSREVIVSFLSDKENIPIDEVVTADRKRFGRFPYSLHTDVCRVPQPIDSPSFDYQNNAVPSFLQS